MLRDCLVLPTGVATSSDLQLQAPAEAQHLQHVQGMPFEPAAAWRVSGPLSSTVLTLMHKTSKHLRHPPPLVRLLHLLLLLLPYLAWHSGVPSPQQRLLTCRRVAVIHLRLLLISSGVSPKRCGCSAARFTALSNSFT
jgi:hypothetical protein